MGNGNDSETGETAIETDQDTGHANSTDIGVILISLSVLLLMAARELGICEETSIRGLGSQLRTICYIWYTVYQLVAGVAGLSLGCFVAGHGHKLCEHQLFVINF